MIAHRNALGLSQERLAELLQVDKTTVWRWENYLTEPRAYQRPALARALQLSLDDLAHLLDSADNPSRPTRSELAASWNRDGVLLESPSQILDRIRQTSPTVTDEYLDGLDSFVLDVVNRYELEGPRQLAPEVLRQRLHVQQLILTSPPSRRGLRLMRTAGQLSAQLAYMAVNFGQFGPAGAYASEAFHLADEAGADDLKAWVRGTQSFGAYFRKRYDEALYFAQDGLRYAGNGVQAVRLGINGEARALAHLRRRNESEQAMSRAYSLLEEFSPDDGMSSCISFDLYSEARVVSNAATAFLALGRTEESLRQVNRVIEVVDRSNSTWSKALVRLDAATAEAQADERDLDRAVQLVREVRALTETDAAESIKQRTAACLDTLRPWKEARIVSELLDEIDEETRGDDN
jgi:transcriptional regulator with XRE-family HTH domain